MKIKTSELTDLALRYAVAVAEGATDLSYDTVATYWVTLNGKDRALGKGWAQSFMPDTDWAVGGPIIERFGIAIRKVKVIKSWHWEAGFILPSKAPAYGPTPLIAAMRCLVSSKLGDEVDIPDNLCH